MPVMRPERYFVVDGAGERVELVNVRRSEGDPIYEQISGRGNWLPLSREADRFVFETSAVLEQDDAYEVETSEDRRFRINVLKVRRGPNGAFRYETSVRGTAVYSGDRSAHKAAGKPVKPEQCPRCNALLVIHDNTWPDHFPPDLRHPRELPEFCSQSGTAFRLTR